MLVGYARTSTADQAAGLEAQLRDLHAAGCEEVFSEHAPATAARRPEMESSIQFVRKGDTLVVTKPDRLARSVEDLLAIVGRLSAKKVGLRILSMGGAQVQTDTPTGKLMLTMLSAVAEFERDLMLERQREGIAKAKQEGKYLGRAPTARRKATEILRLKAEGHRPADIARIVGVARSSVYRIMEEAGTPANPRPPSSLLQHLEEAKASGEKAQKA